MVFPTVMAEDTEKPPRMVKVSELPIYENPEERFAVKILPEKSTPFTEGVTTFRKSLFTFLDRFKETTDVVKEKYEIGKAHTQQTIDFLQNDPGTLPRAGVITVAGLGGLVLGARGGVLKKLFYTSFAGLGAASLCYPNQAVQLTTDGYNKAMEHAKTMWSGPDEDKKEKGDNK